MKDLIERSYEAIKDRGLINKDTLIIDFVNKLKEEVSEIEELCDKNGLVRFVDMEKFLNEWSDAMSVCFNFFTHYSVDIENIFKSNVEKNETRAKKTLSK